MIVGVLRAELYLPRAHSLKERRSVVKSLRDQLRGRFNVAVAELDINERWQRAAIGCTVLGEDRRYLQGLLQAVSTWLRATGLAEVSTLEEEDVYPCT